MKHLIPILLTLMALGPATLLAQPGTDEQLAAQYYQTGDYEKAILYYEKLFRDQPNDYYYEQLFKSYVGLKDLESAEKLVKDRMKRRGDDPRFTIDLGSLYRMTGQDDKAVKEFEKAIKLMRSEQGSIRQVANGFIRVNELDMALQAYERGQRMMKDGQVFHYEVANIHAMKGDVPRMVTAYMELLAANEAYIQSVQNSLSRFMDFNVQDDRTELLRTELLRRIQRDPQRTIFQELLIWMYIQQKDLSAAFVQSRAMDKRFEEGGHRLMELARIALANKDYSTAFKCYEYVQDLARNDANYLQARIGSVRTRYAELKARPEPTTADLRDLDNRATHVLQELGLSKNTIELLREQAELNAYHINDRDRAIALLEEGLSLASIDRSMKAQLKLDLGDIHLLNGDIWEASLLYSQVDLDFKYDMLGHEARLRNAKVSFYAGDFIWAQAQLNVLKASTSKLIANDAMELSLRITDALGLDSNSVPLSYFARAELLRIQHRYDEALAVLDSLTAEFPMHPLGDDVLYERYRIAHKRHRYTEAATHLEKLLELYPLDILVDNALLDLGKLYEDKLNDREKAMGYYEQLMFDQPGSIFVPDARERYRKLRGDHLEGPGTAPHDHPH
jgi:tetratricopeptide (TPR) repeat protein